MFFCFPARRVATYDRFLTKRWESYCNDHLNWLNARLFCYRFYRSTCSSSKTLIWISAFLGWWSYSIEWDPAFLFLLPEIFHPGSLCFRVALAQFPQIFQSNLLMRTWGNENNFITIKAVIYQRLVIGNADLNS